MPTYQFKGENGRTYAIEGPAGASDDQVRAEVLKQHPEAVKSGLPAPPSSYPGSTLGLPKIPSPLDVMMNPEGPVQTALSIPLTAAVTGGAGTLAQAAKIPAVLGRVGAQAGLGAGRAAMQGESPVTGGLVDALIAGLTEGAGALVTGGAKIGPVKAGLKEWGKSANLFEWAKGAPEKALKAIEDRVPQALRFFEVPSLSDKPMRIGEAVKALAKTRGHDYDIARQEIVQQLDRLELPGIMQRAMTAGQEFGKRTAKHLYDPSEFAKIAESLRGVLSSPAGRSVADAIMTTPLSGVPIGELIGAALAPEAARGIPGARHLLREEGDTRRGGF